MRQQIDWNGVQLNTLAERPWRSRELGTLNSSQEVPKSSGFVVQICAYSIALKSGTAYMTNDRGTKELRGGKEIPDDNPRHTGRKMPQAAKRPPATFRDSSLGRGLAAQIVIRQ